MTFDSIADICIMMGLSIIEAKKGLEHSLIVQALRRTEGNCTHAAKLLKIHRNTLARLMITYEVDRKKYFSETRIHQVKKLSKRRLEQLKRAQASRQVV